LIEHRNEWYLLDGDEVAYQLDSDLASGLTDEEVRSMLARYGPNELTETERRTTLSMLVDQFKEVLVLILLGAAVVSAILGEIEDTAVIMVIVVLNAVLGVVQESRAERSLESLKQLSTPEATVIRNGCIKRVSVTRLVPGDVVKLEAGAYVPADIRLTEIANLKVNESALTGEAEPVEKTTDRLEDPDVLLGDRKNMVHMGTFVTYGRCSGIVVNTGMNTEMGEIAQLIQGAPEELTPLQRKLRELGKWLGGGALLLVLVVFIAGILRGEPLFEMFMTSVSLAVAAIPEGLPAIVTIVLALGVQRMAKRRAIVRRLPAVETLGTVSVICSDKTGTLTRNEMTVTRLYAGGKTYGVTGEGYDPTGSFYFMDNNGARQDVDPDGDISLRALLIGGALANDAKIAAENGVYSIAGDPTEGALVVAAEKAGYRSGELAGAFPRTGEIPFDSGRKCMTTVHKLTSDAADILSLGEDTGNNEAVSFTKGAPDVLLDHCTHVLREDGIHQLTAEEKERLLEVNSDLAGQALRVLGVAFRFWLAIPRDIDQENIENNLVFLGFSGMMDPPRAEAAEAVELSRTAGIKPLMITGDHELTAVAIARSLGIANGDVRSTGKVVSGRQLDELSDEELFRYVNDVDVFARVSPKHKMRIVSALKRHGCVVAMTGDGVNDAPALKAADIGVAMGVTGTDVAREASEMVLADDNFATIVAAVSEGRAIFANIRKFIHYLLSCNVGEILAIFSAIILGLGRPLTAIQILWVNLVTDGLPALALGMEPPEPGVMKAKPRSPSESVFAGGLGLRILWQGALIGVLTLTGYYLGTKVFNDGQATARTMAFATLSFSQLVHAWNTRSTTMSVFRLGFLSNRYMVYAFVLSGAMQLGVLALPFFHRMFGIGHLGAREWLVVAGLSVMPLLVVEGVKYHGKKDRNR